MVNHDLLQFQNVVYYLYSQSAILIIRAAKGPERSGGTQPEDFDFLVGSGRRSAYAMGK